MHTLTMYLHTMHIRIRTHIFVCDRHEETGLVYTNTSLHITVHTYLIFKPGECRPVGFLR